MTTPATTNGPVRSHHGRRWVWILLSVLAIAGGLLATLGYRHWQSRGSLITVHFQEIHGMRVGHQLRYRGMVVGEVTEVNLRPDLGGVDLQVHLPPETATLAREGSRFWIVWPTASFASGLGGLDTLVSDQYLTVQPGTGAPAVDFRGDETPPPPDCPPDCFKLQLRSREKSFALKAGAPLICLGVQVGMVREVELMPDGQEVRVRAFVEKQWASLVRDNAVFKIRKLFSAETKLIVTIRLDIQGISGGIELIAPNKPGPAPAQGKVFELVE